MAQIEDYGDKIGGARKDRFSDYLLKLAAEIGTDPAYLKSLSLTQAFPKPDYAALAESGLSHARLAAICVARGTIERKPTGKNVSGGAFAKWALGIEYARRVSIRAISDERPETEADVTRLAGAVSKRARMTLRALRDVPTEALHGAEGMQVTDYRGEMWLLNPGGRVLFKTPETPEEAAYAAISSAIVTHSVKTIAAPKRRTLDERAQDMWAKVKIYGRTTFKVEMRTGGGRIVFETGFPRIADASAWRRANKAAIIDRIKASMGERVERTGSYRDRQGPERRDGNITAEALANRFGLRGIEFGNYVEDARRQRDLNDTCDSFADLAFALGIPERLVGYDGALAVAFGARGNGHAAAHYERTRRVFNLTKSSGAGSTGHEWGHSADNAVAMRNSTDKEERTMEMASLQRTPRMMALHDAWEGYERRMSEIDAGKSKPYWSKPEELFARCFEVWLRDRLEAAGIVNDHLVEIDRDAEVYPTRLEMAGIGPMMDHVMREFTEKMSRDAGIERVAAAAPVRAAPVVAALAPVRPAAPVAEQMDLFATEVDLETDVDFFEP